MRDHVECPLLDSRGRAVLTKCHIITSSSLMESEAFDEVVFVRHFCDLERSVLRCGSQYSRIPEVLCVTIRDKCIVSCHTDIGEITSILGEVGTSFYFLMERGDLFESEHRFIIKELSSHGYHIHFYACTEWECTYSDCCSSRKRMRQIFQVDLIESGKLAQISQVEVCSYHIFESESGFCKDIFYISYHDHEFLFNTFSFELFLTVHMDLPRDEYETIRLIGSREGSTRKFR